MATVSHKPPTLYAKRILHFCDIHGIEVPVGFHTSSAYKFAVVDVAAKKLVAVTWYIESQVIEYLERALPGARLFQVLDFKRGCEMQYAGGARLHRGASFDHRAPNERSAALRC